MNAPDPLPDRIQAVRRIGGLAHQVRAGVRAADRYLTMGLQQDHDTACWLMSGAVGLARELADELDIMAREARHGGVQGAALQAIVKWRVHAHQLHASCRAADLFLEQDAHDDRHTGTWLVASALRLADQLSGLLDDGASRLALDRSRELTSPHGEAAGAAPLPSFGA